MDLQAAKTALRQLHQDLTAGGQPDAELLSLLKTLEDDLHRFAASHEAAPDSHSISDRAQALSVRFNAEYPNLSSTLNDLADKLGKMGI
ncbi:MAG: DUF4404 family protein [Aquabacterium sp.]|jgi:hypothetical protein|nr:MAG: DUF4404 family protein [Aquabacterium sp.]